MDGKERREVKEKRGLKYDEEKGMWEGVYTATAANYDTKKKERRKKIRMDENALSRRKARYLGQLHGTMWGETKVRKQP